jgi:hypothetical protein
MSLLFFISNKYPPEGRYSFFLLKKRSIIATQGVYSTYFLVSPGKENSVLSIFTSHNIVQSSSIFCKPLIAEVRWKMRAQLGPLQVSC